MAIDKEAILWTDEDGQLINSPFTVDGSTPIMFVSAKFFLRFMESMAENPDVLRLINCPGTMELDEETAGEIVQEFLNYVSDEVHATEKG